MRSSSHQLLLFRGQRLEPGDQVTFARRFGSVQVHVMNQYHAEGYPEIYYLSNLGPDGRPSGKHPDRGTVHWHTDGSWARRTGQATLLYAVEVPTAGGETRFASMYDAYEALDEGMKQRLARLRAVHNLDFSRTRRHGEDLMTEEQKKARPPVAHPVVRVHPETGRRCIFLGDHAWYIEDMPFDEGRQLIEDLNAAIIDAGARLHAPVAPGRPGHLGQPLHAAQGGDLRRRRRSARDAPLHRGRRGADLAYGSSTNGRDDRSVSGTIRAPFGLTGAGGWPTLWPECKASGERTPVEIVVLQPLVALIAGILILIIPRLLNYIVAIYLILIGLVGLLGHFGGSQVG